MPELPEVETTRLGLWPALENHNIQKVRVWNSSLRWPVSPEIHNLRHIAITELSRRGKYLILKTSKGSIIIHLGMSGSLRIEAPDITKRQHDHIEILLDSGLVLRFHDPRRFGCFLWSATPDQHPLIRSLGPEPLTESFSGKTLVEKSHGRKVPVKSFIMDSHVVVGVGNIYANEALFKAGIHPLRAAGKISASRYERLTQEIKKILTEAIARGGTTLKDFVNGHGEPGWFQLELSVYGRAGEACKQCANLLKEVRVNNRSTVYCPKCQR
jgi:formamidopyrimidine-DNA glycosylase